MKDLSPRFFVSRRLMHNRFMNLDNPLKVVGHYLLIREMTGLTQQNRFPVVSELVCMVTHWTL